MIERRIMNTQQTPRLVTGIAKLKERGSIQSQNEPEPVSSKRRKKMKKAAEKRQNAMSPFLISNMQLKEKFPRHENEGNVIKEVEYLQSTFNDSTLKMTRY